MPTGVSSWSTTASDNATADSAAPWPEGMAPSQVNDSARGGMASVAKFRDDTAGTLVTSGTSTAYTVSSNQGFASLAAMDGAKLTLKFDQSSGAAPTLAVDGLTAQALQTVAGSAVPSGFFVANSIWTMVYDNGNSAFVVHGVMNVNTASIKDKAVTLQKLYHPGNTSILLGTDSNAALTITGASDNGSGLIRLAVSSTTTFATGQKKTVSDVVGTTEANGTWTITVASSTAIDLQGSTFANAYVSGGTIGGGIEEVSMGNGLTMVGSALTASIVVEPQGYLTLTSGTPIITADVTSATTVYYTPFKGNLINIYDGSSFPLKTFTELSLSLTSSQAASTLYDLFVINDAGTLRLVSGPAWSSSTAGSCSRGTGAGTTELQRLNGVWTNKVSMTGTYGSSTVTVAANCGTYVGSLFVDGSAGQVTCHRSYGQSRKWGVWNAGNRQPIFLKAGDSLTSGSYGSSTYRAFNNSSANSLTIFSGLTEETFDLSAYVATNAASTAVNSIYSTAIGYNSTSTVTGFSGKSGGITNQAGVAFSRNTPPSRLIAAPALGIQTITLLEASLGGTDIGYAGGEANNLLLAKWRG
jgi:hypothetical protein